MEKPAKDDLYVLNHCAKYLARDNIDGRHNYGQFDAADPRGNISEAWRFPIIDTYYDPQDAASTDLNLVTFVYVNRDERLDSDISVIGSFDSLVTPIPLARVAETVYWSVSIVVPKG